jgi:carboxypeptidase PM20D1
VKTSGGHSSRPPAEPPIEILAKAISKINTQPFEIRYSESVEDFMNYTGPEMRLPFKALFANRWLFGPVITSEYKKIPSAAAMLRTTSVATVIKGGSKENVIPSEVTAKINFRILPGDHPRQIYERIKDIISDERVELTLQRNYDEPSIISSSDSPSFKLLSQTINKVFPDAVVAPSLLIAQTDSRHFKNVTENIYRFQPVRMDDKTLDTMHGNNEKVGVKDFMEAIAFYEMLMRGL